MGMYFQQCDHVQHSLHSDKQTGMVLIARRSYFIYISAARDTLYGSFSDYCTFEYRGTCVYGCIPTFM